MDDLEHPAETPVPQPIDRLAALVDRLPRVRLLPLTLVAVGVAVAWGLWKHAPLRSVPNGEIGVRMNRLTGDSSVVRAGTAFVFPGLQDLRLYDLHEQVFHPTDSTSAAGAAPFQSVEGLSLSLIHI